MTAELSPMSINHSSPSTDQSINWSEHVERCKQSGLSFKAYCRANQLTYDTFLYHFRKAYPHPKKTKLIPVKITEADTAVTPSLLCRLVLQDGHSLLIYDERVLPGLLTKLL